MSLHELPFAARGWDFLAIMDAIGMIADYAGPADSSIDMCDDFDEFTAVLEEFPVVAVREGRAAGIPDGEIQRTILVTIAYLCRRYAEKKGHVGLGPAGPIRGRHITNL